VELTSQVESTTIRCKTITIRLILVFIWDLTLLPQVTLNSLTWIIHSRDSMRVLSSTLISMTILMMSVSWIMTIGSAWNPSMLKRAQQRERHLPFQLRIMTLSFTSTTFKVRVFTQTHLIQMLLWSTMVLMRNTFGLLTLQDITNLQSRINTLVTYGMQLKQPMHPSGEPNLWLLHFTKMKSYKSSIDNGTLVLVLKWSRCVIQS